MEKELGWRRLARGPVMDWVVTVQEPTLIRIADSRVYARPGNTTSQHAWITFGKITPNLVRNCGHRTVRNKDLPLSGDRLLVRKCESCWSRQ